MSINDFSPVELIDEVEQFTYNNLGETVNLSEFFDKHDIDYDEDIDPNGYSLQFGAVDTTMVVLNQTGEIDARRVDQDTWEIIA